MDTVEVKRAAVGRWPEILSRVGGIEESLLDGKHHPCPKCGGVDRFRLLDRDDGALYCNKCFMSGNGDGLAAVAWLRGCEFREALSEVAGYLGIGETRSVVAVDLMEEVCRRKRIPIASLRRFGARLDMRGKLQVVRVPMYDEFGQQCSNFDMATLDDKWLKGVCEKDKPSGIFLSSTDSLDGKDVLLTEGVKDAAALDSLGYTVVGLPTKELAVQFVRWFIGARVVVVPDRDIDGEAGARRTAGRLVGVAASVRIAALPGEIKDKGGDGVREILAGRNGESLLRQCIKDAATWAPGANERKGAATMIEVCHRYLDCLDKGGDQTLTTGIGELDAAIGGGVALGEMIVIGAKPSHGKTMLAMQWLDRMAELKYPGLMVSEEMSSLALGKRTLQYITPLSQMHWSQQVESLRSEVNAHYSELAEIYVTESVGTTAAAVRCIDELARDKGIKIAAIDYAGMLKGVGQTRYEQMTNTSLEMKQCATRNNIVLLLLCQLNREIDKRNDHVPKMSDLRESGQIEQDADVILFLQWPVKMDPRYKPHDEYRIYVAKNRNRETRSNIVVATFDPGRQTVSSKPTRGEPFEPEAW